MAYDDHQWALLPLLLSSMLVYLVLFATMFVKFRYRVLAYIGLLLYFHQNAAKDIGKRFSWKKQHTRFNKVLAGDKGTHC